MSRPVGRTTGLALVAALIAGVAAAWMVSDYVQRVERRPGPLVSVLVAAQPIARGSRFDEIPTRALSSRRVPKSFAPVGALSAFGAMRGRRAVVDLSPGAYITDAMAVPVAAVGYRLRRGERAVSIEAVVTPDGAKPVTGQSVDLLASGIAGAAETSLVLSGAELLAVADAGDDAAGTARRFTLRVAAAQAAQVVRADTFAKELRLLVRP